uniref:Adenosine deaminase n=1 Tax=Hirondellea gigas TaxID=1518452 RepID=A0A2P2I9X4_9CRUS
MLMESVKEKPKCRVELHIHLDGAMRPETIWELMRKKQLPLPGDGSLSALKEAATVKEGTDLPTFLKPLILVAPAIQGDLSVIERISREFVEDRSRDHTAYCEARFSPHLLLPPTGGEESTSQSLTWETTTSNNPPAAQSNGVASATTNGVDDASSKDEEEDASKAITVDDVMEAVLRGITDGEKSCPGTKVRLILCCIRNIPEWSWEVLRLCEDYKNRGVVGIDIAGAHDLNTQASSFSEAAEVFQAAAAKGIHRTVHAGEDGGAMSVLAALSDLKAERVGHGYRVIEDEAVYERCKEANLHFETCPHSSYQTGTIRDLTLTSKRHPILRFADDGVSYSISSDDPFLTGTHLTEEYALLRSWGFTEAHIVKANFNAALHCFLPEGEKQQLIKQLKDAYGVVDYTAPVATPSSKRKTTPDKPTISVSTWENR